MPRPRFGRPETSEPREVYLPYPVIDPETGFLAEPPDAAVVAFLWAWIVQFLRIEAADPERAAALRILFGFPADESLFNEDAILPCQD